MAISVKIDFENLYEIEHISEDLRTGTRPHPERQPAAATGYVQLFHFQFKNCGIGGTWF